MMARYIIENEVNTLEQLKQFDIAGYYFVEAESTATELVFKREEQKYFIPVLLKASVSITSVGKKREPNIGSLFRSPSKLYFSLSFLFLLYWRLFLRGSSSFDFFLVFLFQCRFFVFWTHIFNITFFYFFFDITHDTLNHLLVVGSYN